MMQSCHILLNIHLFPVQLNPGSSLSFGIIIVLNNHLLSDWDDLEDSCLSGS